MEICDNCGQKIREAHKEALTRGKLKLLALASREVKKTRVNDVSLKTFNGDTNLYNNFQKLRYHGLIYYLMVDGVRQRGHWMITKTGWSFLLGDIALPKHVVVRNNHIENRAEAEVYAKDIIDNNDVFFETAFEYYNKDGLFLGERPL